MNLTEVIRHGNFLAVQGRALAEGRPSELTREEWLYSYSHIREELSGVKVKVMDNFRENIRGQVVERAMEAVAL